MRSGPAQYAGTLAILATAVLWGTTGTVSSFAPAAALPWGVGAAGLVLARPQPQAAGE